jgi:hypothetical protein
MVDFRACLGREVTRLGDGAQFALRCLVWSIAHPSSLHVHALVIVIDPIHCMHNFVPVMLAVTAAEAVIVEE